MSIFKNPTDPHAGITSFINKLCFYDMIKTIFFKEEFFFRMLFENIAFAANANKKTTVSIPGLGLDIYVSDINFKYFGLSEIAESQQKNVQGILYQLMAVCVSFFGSFYDFCKDLLSSIKNYITPNSWRNKTGVVSSAIQSNELR